MAYATENYRPDIDGMRAIAVLSVFLYHAGATAIPGGFAGVDVFFVISGYLITGLIVRACSGERFSFAEFYLRRAKRILPALLTVVFATLIAGMMLLPEGEIAGLRASAFFSVTFIANLYFNSGSDYFTEQAADQPLLHFWSLAVEEQFYILWPALIWLSWRLSRRVNVVLGVTLILCIASFATSVVQVVEDSRSAFFLLPSRIWELGLGALVAFTRPIGSPRYGVLAKAAGLSLVAGSFVILSSDDPFPGMWAVPPCLGAALLVWPSKANVVTYALGLPPVRFIGLISYSLYLWHWPILTIYREVQGRDQLLWPEVAALLGLTCAVSAASWRWVELPVRQWSGRGSINLNILTASFSLLLLGWASWFLVSPAREWTSERFIVQQQLKRAAVADADVAIVGDSSCLTGVVPAALSTDLALKVKSYCMFGSVGPVGDAAVVRSLVRSGASPAAWVIMVSPLQFGRTSIPNNWKDFVAACERNQNCGYEHTPLSSLLVPLRGAFTKEYSTVEELVAAVAQEGALVDPSDADFSKSPVSFDVPPSYEVFQEPLTGELAKVSKELLFVVIAPVAFPASAVEVETAKERLAALYGVSRKNVLDTPVQLPADRFATRSHLNRVGRAEFSAHLSRQLKLALSAADR
jgi:peptidoglycan/LPS O-acetylase OafA/YrhL